MSDPSPKWAASRTEERRAEILAAARQVVQHDGDLPASIAEVARRVGISPQAVYRYFPDRDSLFSEALQREFSGSIERASHRRRQVLNAALEHFSRQGYRETTMAQLAAAVELSEAALYRYFASKEDIFAALVHERLGALTLFDATTPPLAGQDHRQLLRSAAEQVVSSFERDPDAMRLVFMEGLRNEAAARTVFRELLEPSARALAGLLEEAGRRGGMRAVDEDVVASAFLGMFAFYMMVTHLYMPSAGLETSARRENLLDELVELYARGLDPADVEPKTRRSSGVQATGERRARDVAD